MPCGAVGGRSALTHAKCERALNCAVALLCQSSINTGLVQSIAGRSPLPCPASLYCAPPFTGSRGRTAAGTPSARRHTSRTLRFPCPISCGRRRCGAMRILEMRCCSETEGCLPGDELRRSVHGVWFRRQRLRSRHGGHLCVLAGNLRRSEGRCAWRRKNCSGGQPCSVMRLQRFRRAAGDV